MLIIRLDFSGDSVSHYCLNKTVRFQIPEYYNIMDILIAVLKTLYQSNQTEHTAKNRIVYLVLHSYTKCKNSLQSEIN